MTCQTFQRPFDASFAPRERHVNAMRALIVACAEDGYGETSVGSPTPEIGYWWLHENVPAAGRVFNELIAVGFVGQTDSAGWSDVEDESVLYLTSDGLGWLMKHHGKADPKNDKYSEAWFTAWGKELAPLLRRRGEPGSKVSKPVASAFEKKAAYTVMEAVIARNAIAKAVKAGTLTPRQAAAHKAWVTMRTTKKEEAA